MRAISLCSCLLIVIIAVISVFGTSIGVEIHAVGDAAYVYVDGSWIQTAQERLGDIRAIWAFSEDDIFLGSVDGAVYHWNGSTWNMSYQHAHYNSVLDIWGTSNSNIYVCLKDYLSYDGKLLHFDGSIWSEVALPQPGDSYESVYGFSEDDVYVVAIDDNDKNLIYHSLGGDPQTWELVDISSLGVSMDCSDVWGSSGTDVFIMGEEGEIIHWDGTQWELMNSGVSEHIYTSDIWGSSANDVFATLDDVIIHYDGNAQNDWTEMSIPSTVYRVHWITGTSSSNVIVGSRGDDLQYNILKYDGMHWTELTDSDYKGSGDAFVFSENNALLIANGGKLYRYTGLDIERVDNEFGFVKSLSAVTSTPTGSFYAGSIEGDVLMYVYDSWHEIARPTENSICDIIAFADDDICVFTDGEAFHFDGMSWQLIGSSEMGCWKAWGMTSDHLYTAAGNSIYHYDGNDWSRVWYVPGWSNEYESYYVYTQDIWGTSNNNIYAVGCTSETIWIGPGSAHFTCPMIVHYDGTEWTNQETGVGCPISYPPGEVMELNAVWGTAADDIWTAGYLHSYTVGLMVLHYTGSSWKQVEAPSTRHSAIWSTPTGSDVFFLVGRDGEVQRYNGSDWNVSDLTNVEMRDMWGASESDPKIIATVKTDPAGLEFSVDGNIYDDSYSAIADPGSTYEIGVVVSPQVAPDGHEYAFTEWSDGGDTVHTITVPDTSVIYTAYFGRTTVDVTVETHPEGLEFSVNDSTYDDSYSFIADPGSTYEIGVVSPQVPSDGHEYAFTEWSDGGDTVHVIVVPDTNVTYTAHFERTTVAVTVEAYPDGPAFSVDSTVHNESYTFITLPGSTYEVGVESPQLAVNGRDYYFKEWSDGGDTVHTITVPDTSMEYTAYFERTVTVEIATSPVDLDILVLGEIYPSPYIFTMISGTEIEIGTLSPQKDKGIDYYFHYWLDDELRIHTVTLPIGDIEYTAVFGTGYLTGDEVEPIPLVNALHQNHPNPFNPNTTINFSLESHGYASLAIYDVAGRLVRVLIDDVIEAGPRDVTWDGKDNAGRGVASGVYFYRLEAGSFTETKKMVLLR